MYECDTCTRCFVTEHQVDQHMDSKDHWAYDFKCDTCDDQYRTQEAVDEHMAKNGHCKNYCSDCDRHFQSESNYRAVGIAVPSINHSPLIPPTPGHHIT